MAFSQPRSARGWSWTWSLCCCGCRALAALLLVSLLLPALTQSKHIPSFVGPYIAYGKFYSMCPPDVWDINARVGQIPTLKMYWRFSHFNPIRPRELQTVTGNASVPYDIRDDSWIRVTLATRSNNQWKDNAFVFNFPTKACWAIRTQAPGIFRGIFDLDPTIKGECVIPKGFYSFIDRPFNWTFPSFLVMPYGHWRFRAESGRPGSKTKLMCFEVECYTIPFV